MEDSWISFEEPWRNESEAIRKMLDPIVLPTLYFIAVLELIFQAGVVFYAYKVTRITGSFRAWTMIIVAFSLLTIQSVVGLVLTLSLPTDQIANLIRSVGETTTILGSTVTAIAGALLFIGVFGLAKRFENQAKPSA
jgi:hypothetical protein